MNTATLQVEAWTSLQLRTRSQREQTAHQPTHPTMSQLPVNALVEEERYFADLSADDSDSSDSSEDSHEDGWPGRLRNCVWPPTNYPAPPKRAAPPKPRRGRQPAYRKAFNAPSDSDDDGARNSVRPLAKHFAAPPPQPYCEKYPNLWDMMEKLEISLRCLNE